MPNNPAGRVAQIIERARNVSAVKNPQQATVLDAWAYAFELPPDMPPRELRFVVVRGLELMQAELDAVEQRLPQASRIPESTYRAKIESVRQAMDVGLLFSNWSAAVAQHLDAAESANYLRDTIAHVLGEDEVAAASDVIARIREALQEIRAEAEGAPFDAPLRAFVLDLTDALERALREYRIAGEKAVRREIERLLWEWAEFERQYPKTKRTALYVRVGGALALGAALLTKGEAVLDAVAKMPAHVREIRQELPKLRATLGLPEPSGAKRINAPREMKRIPAVAGPST